VCVCLCVCRQQEMASELAEAKQRCEFLDRDNAALYAEVAELRMSSAKAGSVDECRRQLAASQSRVSELEDQLASCERELNGQTELLRVADQNVAQLRDINKQLYDDIRKLQDGSAYSIIS